MDMRDTAAAKVNTWSHVEEGWGAHNDSVSPRVGGEVNTRIKEIRASCNPLPLPTVAAPLTKVIHLPLPLRFICSWPSPLIGQGLSSQENTPLQRRGRERETCPQPHLHPLFYHPWERLQGSLGGAILKDLKSKFTLLREWREKEGGTISFSFSFLSPISPPSLSCCYHRLLFAALPFSSLAAFLQSLPPLSIPLFVRLCCFIPSSSWGSCLMTCSVRHVFDSKSHVSQI